MDSYLGAFATTVLDSFQTVWQGLLQILPNVIAAIVILVIGWIIAAALAKLVRRIIEFTKVDEVINKAGLDKSMSEIGIDFNLAKLISWLVKWFILIVVLIAVAEVLRLSQITTFLQTIAFYIPNIIIAIVILFVGLVLGNFVYRVVSKAVQASKLSVAERFLAALAKWSIFVFALLAALTHLKIAPELIQTLFTGLIGMLALAGGLAFGLGGKGAASDFIDKLRREIH